MTINTTFVRMKVLESNWSGAELGRRMGISTPEANRVLNGERKGGRKTITGIRKAFPNADENQLFILTENELISTMPDDLTNIIPNIEYIKRLMQARNWSGSDLARNMAVSVTEANRILRGARKGGISGLLKAFPDERWQDLFIPTIL